jgi:cation:H+ antiporter
VQSPPGEGFNYSWYPTFYEGAMAIIFATLVLLLGFVLLVKGADCLIEGASSLALKLSVSEIAIGLTVVAFGTSSPELVVNIFASFDGRSEIVLGNIIGSNIFNILLILGVVGIIYPVRTEHNTVWKEIPFALVSTLVLTVQCNDYLLNYDSEPAISRGDGLILLLFFVLFLSYVFGISRVEGRDTPDVKKLSVYKIIFFLMVGLVGLAIGGKLVVESSIKIARWLTVSDKLIGLTIVAGGTSLPELVTSALAAYRRKSDIAIGNIVGSNIFNIFFIMGVSALIAPVHFQSVFNSDLIVLVISSFLLFIIMFTGEKRVLDRWEALLFSVFYATYVVYLVMRK